MTGLAAVCQAIGNFQLAKYNFNDWGVLGAPRFLGRVAMHGAIQKFLVEGAWGISPHLIPHRLLHAAGWEMEDDAEGYTLKRRKAHES